MPDKADKRSLNDDGTAVLGRGLAACRYFLLIAVIGCMIVAISALLFGAALVINTVDGVLRDMEFSLGTGKALALATIEVIDLFLIATVAYITAAGLYTLFISRDVPGALHLGIESLDDLKERVIGVLVVALGVLFLGDAVNWNGEPGLLYFGAASALVIAALGYFIRHKEKHGDEE